MAEDPWREILEVLRQDRVIVDRAALIVGLLAAGVLAMMTLAN